MRLVAAVLSTLLYSTNTYSTAQNALRKINHDRSPDHGHDNDHSEDHGHGSIVTEPDAHHGEHGEAEDHALGKHMEHAEHVDSQVADHVGHGTKAHGTGVNGPCPGNQSANSVAVGLMASVTLVPLLVYMTMCKAADGAVRDLTFRAVDISTSIFLAVLWFSASADVLDSDLIKHSFTHAEEVFAILQVFLLYALTMLVAHHFRHNKYYLITFCGCAGHYIAFAAIKATGESQHVAGSMAGKEYGPAATFAFCFVVFAILFGMFAICFFAWRKYQKDERNDFDMAVEELEFDIVGLVLSFAIMQAVRHLLTGRYPSQAHFFLQEAQLTSEVSAFECGLDDAPHLQHTAGQRAIMLMLAIVLTALSVALLEPLERLKEQYEYFGHKAIHGVQVVLVMCVAWSYLLWGEWQFYETYFHGDTMFGKMVFAVLATIVCMLIITALAFATADHFSYAKGYANLCVFAVSLTCAWSWEHCFHTAINVIAAQYQVGYDGAVPKLVVALLIPAVILPGYVMFLKPIAAEASQRLEGEEKEERHHALLERAKGGHDGPQAGDSAAPSEPSTA